jgi:hypothetical protein
MVRRLLSKIKQNIFHTLRIYPVYRVIGAINERFPLSGKSILEAFAFTGAWQTRAFKKYPSYLEAWEIDGSCLPELKKNLPHATIRIVNSFEQVRICDRRFDFINVDTHQGIFGQYCENFEFFPLLFRVASDEFVVNLNVIPDASARWRKKYPDLFSAEHLRRRAEFYKTKSPESVSLDLMLKTYGEIAAGNGYEICWYYYLQRTLTWYLALHLKKKW